MLVYLATLYLNRNPRRKKQKNTGNQNKTLVASIFLQKVNNLERMLFVKNVNILCQSCKNLTEQKHLKSVTSRDV